jgi:hypothetical protein
MMAFQLAKNKNLSTSFSELTGCAGKEWLNRFLSHHNKNIISIRSATGTQWPEHVGSAERPLTVSVTVFKQSLKNTVIIKTEYSIQ